MADAERCCTGCRNVLLAGAPWLQQMIALGFVGCRLDNAQYQCCSPGVARNCLAFDDASRPAQLAAPVEAAAAAPAQLVKKIPADLFNF